VDFVILEKSTRSGGVVFSEKVNDYVFEWGPRGIRPKSRGQVVLELVEELGLWEDLVFANDMAKKRYLYHNDKLQVLPHSLWSLLSSPYLKLLIKAIIKDFTAVKFDGDETIASFVDRHFGNEFRALFFDSMVSGVWAGDVEKMSISATLPLLKELEGENGSILKALITHQAKSIDSKKYDKDITSKALFSFKGGMQTLVNALENHLNDFIVYNVDIDAIHFSDKVELVVNGESQFFDELVSTIPAYSIAAYTGVKLSALLQSINYAPIAVLNMKLPKSAIDFDGFGFLVPSSENSVVLGMVANSNTFTEHTTDDYVVNTVMMGGSRYSIEELSGLNLKHEAGEFLKHVFNKELDIEFQEIILIDKSIPQYDVGHLDKVMQIEELSPNNLTLLGGYMYGVSLIDIVIKSKELARDF
ncbi:MAG: protoporphyrinogen oxidase, partial [Flavobacteriales bacterium]|nr:protoporphyrinogen oxidase [Flavobacteriales bacterium]